MTLKNLLCPILTIFIEESSVTSTISKQRFIEIVKNLHSTASPLMNPPLFIFKMCSSAAGFNAKVLVDNNFDLASIIARRHPSQLSYGSEFRDPVLLKELLRHHPFWPRLNSILAEGAHFPLEEISSEERESDLLFHSSRGNHKSASKNMEILRDIIKEDIERGFAIPLPITALHFFKNASLAPLGCVQQSLIDMVGNRVVKHRMTHDQSFIRPFQKISELKSSTRKTASHQVQLCSPSSDSLYC
ncbi:MAG: hypothetical protein ACK53Y_16315 [bacterium]